MASQTTTVIILLVHIARKLETQIHYIYSINIQYTPDRCEIEDFLKPYLC